MQTALDFGIISLLPAVIALVIAIKAKRVIEPLLFGILTAVTILDIAANGWGHAILFSIVNVFQAVAGHPADEAAGLRGVGILKGTDRPEVVFIVVLCAFAPSYCGGYCGRSSAVQGWSVESA